MEKKTKKRWLIGVGVVLLLLVAAVWGLASLDRPFKVERLALDGEPGQQLAADLMDRFYGAKQHDEDNHCWRSRNKEGDSFCLQPVALDRVDTGDQKRLYLFASGSKRGADEEEIGALVGAFVVNADTQELIAGSKAIPFANDGAQGPEHVQLLPLSANGYMAWFANGYQSGEEGVMAYPQFFAPKGKKVANISGELFAQYPQDQEDRQFEYEIDASRADVKVYPLQVSVKDSKGKELAAFSFRFDQHQWAYVCVDNACRRRTGIPGKAEQPLPPVNEKQDRPTNANEALFGSGGRSLSEADLKEVMSQLDARFVSRDDNAGFVGKSCDTPYSLSGEFKRDGEQEQLWVSGGDTCTSGATGNSIWVFVRDEGGHLRANLGVPAAEARTISEQSAGVHDLRLSGAGYCDSQWRWNGKEFAHLKNIATQPSGCDKAGAP